MTFCTSCGADTPAGARFCPACGRTVTAHASHAAPAAPAYAESVSPAASPGHASASVSMPPPALTPPPEAARAPPVSQGAAIAALLLNILVWPGLGTLVAGDRKGWKQGFLALGGIVLMLTVIGLVLGVPMWIGAWVWGIVSGVNLLNGKPA